MLNFIDKYYFLSMKNVFIHKQKYLFITIVEVKNISKEFKSISINKRLT